MSGSIRRQLGELNERDEAAAEVAAAAPAIAAATEDSSFKPSPKVNGENKNFEGRFLQCFFSS